MATLRQTKIKGFYEYTRELCPICHKTGGCMVHEDGNKVVCTRVPSKTVFSQKFPSWMHYLVEKKQIEKKEFIEGNIKAPADQLDAVYNCLLRHLTLSDAHLNHLTGEQRQLTAREIMARGYKTLPEKTFSVANAMTEEIASEYFKGVPGFFEAKYGWGVSGASGILIPYRNEKNQIIGFQVRVDNPPNEVTVDKGSFKNLKAYVIEQPNLVRILDGDKVLEEVALEFGENTHAVYDENNYGFVKLKKGQRYFWLSSSNHKNGTGAGDPLPVHVAVPSNQLSQWVTGETHKTNSVWITEGGLKADIAAEHIGHIYNKEELKEIGSTVLGIPGINTWRYLLPMLEAMEVKHVNLAIDMDLMSNPDVAYHTKEFIAALKEKGYTASMAMWNDEDGKGIDDLFIAKKFPNLRKFF